MVSAQIITDETGPHVFAWLHHCGKWNDALSRRTRSPYGKRVGLDCKYCEERCEVQYKGYWKVKTVDFEFRGDAKAWCAHQNAIDPESIDATMSVRNPEESVRALRAIDQSASSGLSTGPVRQKETLERDWIEEEEEW